MPAGFWERAPKDGEPVRSISSPKAKSITGWPGRRGWGWFRWISRPG